MDVSATYKNSKSKHCVAVKFKYVKFWDHQSLSSRRFLWFYSNTQYNLLYCIYLIYIVSAYRLVTFKAKSIGIVLSQSIEKTTHTLFSRHVIVTLYDITGTCTLHSVHRWGGFYNT